jgi:hypothetical protein
VPSAQCPVLSAQRLPTRQLSLLPANLTGQVTVSSPIDKSAFDLDLNLDLLPSTTSPPSRSTSPVTHSALPRTDVLNSIRHRIDRIASHVSPGIRDNSRALPANSSITGPYRVRVNPMARTRMSTALLGLAVALSAHPTRAGGAGTTPLIRTYQGSSFFDRWVSGERFRGGTRHTIMGLVGCVGFVEIQRATGLIQDKWHHGNSGHLDASPQHCVARMLIAEWGPVVLRSCGPAALRMRG